MNKRLPEAFNAVSGLFLRLVSLLGIVLFFHLLPGSSGMIFAQTVEVTLPSDLSVCGAMKTATIVVTNDGADDIINLEGNLSLSTDFEVSNLNTVITPGGNVAFGGTDRDFTLPDLLVGESVEFTIDVRASCTATSGPVTFTLDYEAIMKTLFRE